MTIPYTLLGGYLGAGKTTLLNHLLLHNQGQKLALVINDFGALNIDADLIASETEQQINLTNGCVCCGMSAGFDEALEILTSRDPLPDRIIVEASGVADVISLAQYGHHPGLELDAVLVVADAETVQAKAQDKYVARTVTRQLQGADLIVLNKADLVSCARMEELTAWLMELAPETPVLPTRYCALPAELLLGLEARKDSRSAGSDHSHESYATWHFEFDAGLPRAAVDRFVDALPRWVLRAKGFFNASDGRLLYQQVGSRRTLTTTDRAGPTRLMVIGLQSELEVELLETLALQLTAG